MLLLFSPSWQPSPTQPLAHALTSEMEETEERIKVTKLMGWDKDGLRGKAEVACTQVKSDKEFIHHFPRASRCSARRARLPPTWSWLGKTTPLWTTLTLFLLLPPALYTVCFTIKSGISLRSAGVSCPGCIPSQLLAHSQPSVSVVGWGAGKNLDSV